MAGLLWAAIVLAVVTTAPEDGANIGAGLLFLIAVPCTVTAVALRLVSRRRQPSAVGPHPSPAGGALATQSVVTTVGSNPIASWALAVGIIGLALAFTPIAGTEAAYVAGVAVSSVLCLGAVVLGWLGRRRAAARHGANSGLALAGIIVGASGLGVQGLVILELVLLTGTP